MFAAAHPVGKTQGCGRVLAPGFGLRPEAVNLRAHVCLFYKCLQNVPLTHAGTRGPMAGGPRQSMGRETYSTKMQVGKEGHCG